MAVEDSSINSRSKKKKKKGEDDVRVCLPPLFFSQELPPQSQSSCDPYHRGEHLTQLDQSDSFPEIYYIELEGRALPLDLLNWDDVQNSLCHTNTHIKVYSEKKTEDTV